MTIFVLLIDALKTFDISKIPKVEKIAIQMITPVWPREELIDLPRSVNQLHNIPIITPQGHYSILFGNFKVFLSNSTIFIINIFIF